MTIVLVLLAAVSASAAAPARLAPLAAPVLKAEARILARDAAPKDGRARSVIVGTLEGRQVAGDEVWDATLTLRPRARYAALEAPVMWRRPKDLPLDGSELKARVRAFLRPNSLGVTILGGVAVHDFGYGSGGVVFDGEAELELLELHPIDPQATAGMGMDDAMTRVLGRPEDFAPKGPLAPEPAPETPKAALSAEAPKAALSAEAPKAAPAATKPASGAPKASARRAARRKK